MSTNEDIEKCDVQCWRFEQLLRLLSHEQIEEADRLAAIPEYDWHELEKLINQGCPTNLALAITAP